MSKFAIGSEDDWSAALEEHPELAVCERESLFEEGALERALKRIAACEKTPAPAASGEKPTEGSEAGSSPLGELLRGAVDLSAMGSACAAAYGRERTAPPEPVPAQTSSVAQTDAVAFSKQRVFDLHCDTLDRLALHGAQFATLWSRQDAGIPAELMSSLGHNACHLALDRMAEYAWCQCFAVFIPDEFRGDAAWAFFQRVRRYFEEQMTACSEAVAQVRDGRCVDDTLASGKAVAILTVEGAAFLEDPMFAGEQNRGAQNDRGLGALADFIARSRAAEADADADRALREAELAGTTLTDEQLEAIERKREAAACREAACEQDDMAKVDGAARKRQQDPFFRLQEAARAGVKMMTLTWNGPNTLGSGHDTVGGLTRFGREVVGEMERLHMVVDVSHLNDRGFSDLLDTATRPFAASHSNARSVCGHRRNLTDAQAHAVFSSGGIVGLNYCRDFLRADGGDPSPDDVLRHVDRLLELGGYRGLCLGSDYDGTDVPSWLDGCQHVGTLHGLIERHFGRDVAERIFYENARDFFARNEG